MKKYRSLRAYAGDLCKRDGGLSEAKIGDVVQILNMVADDVSGFYSYTFAVGMMAQYKPPYCVMDLLSFTGFKRCLKREKELKRKKKA